MRPISRLTVVCIRPSKYDDDGYVIRYVRGVLPSNTLACMRSLTLAFAERWLQDRGIEIDVVAYDELVEHVPVAKLRRMNRGGRKVVAALVGVQSNQFPRAADLARTLTSNGIKTLIGGFHVSGILAMFGEPTPEIRELMDVGVTVVQGEAEHVWESIVADVVAGREKILYEMDGYPDISHMPVPQPDPRYMKKFALPDLGTIDCSRGCPFNCSFCTIINVQGRKMRYRCADSVIATIRDNYENGLCHYFFTDDNFSRNPHWEPILDGLIDLRENEGYDLTFMMQVDTCCHTIRNFVDKAARAGCTQVFIGMESINTDNLKAVGKNQNHVDDYAAFIDSWHRASVLTHVGYIIGFPFDSPDSVRSDIDRLKNEIKVDQASFFVLTPLPGSRDHYDLVKSGANLDPDLDKYDSFHTVMDHPLMTRDELFETYNAAWESFYSFDNLKKILMRAGTKCYWDIFKNIMWYKNSLLEPLHPMVAGFIRRKGRMDVRPGTTVMGIVPFYLKRIREMVSGFRKRIGLFFELEELWWLTRKPDDPRFKFVADFSNAIADAYDSLSSFDVSDSYAKWSEELNAFNESLKATIARYRNTGEMSLRARTRYNRLIEEMSAQIRSLDIIDNIQRHKLALSETLAAYARRAEDIGLKSVAHRRRINRTYSLAWDRLKHGRLVSCTLSLPRVAYCSLKGAFLSVTFAYHLIHKVR